MNALIKTIFLCVAVAGSTADGREILEQWLIDAAATYNRKTYTARIWPEHFRSLTPGGDFKAQGDVAALKTEMVDIGGEKRLGLFAQLEPLPSLVDMVRRGEKIFTSVEITPDFAGTGKAYLTGLAVTDSPASLGTDALMFAAQRFNTHVSDELEATLELEATTEPPPAAVGKFTQFKMGIMSTLAKFKKSSDAQVVELAEMVENVTKTLGEEIEQQATQYSELSKQVQELGEQLAGKNLEFADLQKKYQHLDTTDANPQQRPPATGGNGFALTTC